MAKLPKLRRSADYARDLVRSSRKKTRECEVCQAPILRKKELIALLDEKPKSAKAAQKLLGFTAAQLDGFCSKKCRKQAKATERE